MTNRQTLTMRATLPEAPRSNAINMANNKETISTLKVIDRNLKVYAEARLYMARRSDGASSVFCSLWVHGNAQTSGHGKAGGYGYHKQSAALQAAITSAGIVLHGSNYASWGGTRPNYKKQANIGGCGDGSMHMALMAIARAAGARGKLAVV